MDGVKVYIQDFNNVFEHFGITRRLTKSEIAGFMRLEEKAFLETILPEWPEETRMALDRAVLLRGVRMQPSMGGLHERSHVRFLL